ncbi:MAG: hypothetical protein A2Y62_10360 [Candidatus Fischerbacteria bacterium RBG_13_37_8]|uniref:Endonuclease GajA/Old nuclease/RecF-like AAA domain-containing protein n=1 Tax=Candidatus Fischerbacteria bacterium RBG_13_37_8 TaxID=1817863 RepID=A0A1F5VQH0_9BACT|nr:MAG: hypothetical protein A2Y62_10360 [Candidatus Fischerbacteria bacterium RBG_13_37_8]
MKTKIEKIWIENYRGIRNGFIDQLQDINIFVGRNGSGKSTILEAIFLASHNFKNTPEPDIYNFKDGSKATTEDKQEAKITKLEVIANKRNLIARPVAVMNQHGSRTYSFFGLDDKDWWFKGKNIEEINLRFKMKGLKFIAPATFFIKDEDAKINFKYQQGDIYEIPESLYRKAYEKHHVGDIDLQSKVEGKIYDDDTHVQILIKGKQSELKSFPPVTEYDSFFSNIIYADSSVMLMKSIEHNLWEYILSSGKKKSIISLFNKTYPLQINDIDYSPKGFYVTLQDEGYGIYLDNLGAGMRIGLRLIILLSLFKDTAVLLEEFDAYEHAESLKQIIDIIFQTSKENNLQFFITTHRMESLRAFLEMYQDYPEINGIIAGTILKEDGEFSCKPMPFSYADHLTKGGLDIRDIEDYA